MRRSYSLYEAKARLSAIIRQVREGQRVVVTVHGEPVAEIRPLAQDAVTIAERLDRLVSWCGRPTPRQPSRRLSDAPARSPASSRSVTGDRRLHRYLMPGRDRVW
jgi:prevent-host-death family protein